MVKVTEKQRDLSRVPKQLRDYSFKPGQTGNAGGLPKHGRIDATIRDFMGPKEKRAVVQAMYDAVVEDRNVQAATWLAERGWGKLPIEFNGNITTITELVASLDVRGTREAS